MAKHANTTGNPQQHTKLSLCQTRGMHAHGFNSCRAQEQIYENTSANLPH